GQLTALRQQSLASIMCQHLELDSLQPMAFRSDLVQGNQLQDCSAFQPLGLQFWKRYDHSYPERQEGRQKNEDTKGHSSQQNSKALRYDHSHPERQRRRKAEK
ncbi:unnamed protein product, partial [Meganyctiphanes norvegica]